MILNEKWEVIRLIALSVVCVFGLVTCHGIDSYRNIRKQELDVEQLKAEATKAEAEAAKAKYLNQGRPFLNSFQGF